MNSHHRTRKSVRSVVTLLPNIIAQCLFPCSDELRDLCQAIIDKLPDDVLLDIFDFYLDDDSGACERRNADAWFTLVHVCRRWRTVVFVSPRRLNLALRCRDKTPVRAMLDIWPALPMEIEHDWKGKWEAWPDNIIAALEHRDRVRSIDFINFPSFIWNALVGEVMQVPFPELTCLRFWTDGSLLNFPGSLLDGSAPRLRTLRLKGIRFQAAAIPNLLLSASGLVDLDLWNLPDSYFGYISPESMVACLSSLDRLETFHLGFRSYPYPPLRPSSPPQTRVVLPALSYFAFEGVTEYSEALVACIDTPKLSRVYMSFFKLAVLDIPYFRQFIGRAKALKSYEAAKVVFDGSAIRLELDPPHGSTLEITFNFGIDRQVSYLTLVCRQLSPFLSLIKRLDLIPICSRFEPRWAVASESTQFLEFFQLFTAIQSLYVSERLVPFIAPALRELVGERATEVLPNLRDFFLGGSTISETIQGAIQPLLAARQLSGQPIAVHLWEEESADL